MTPEAGIHLDLHTHTWRSGDSSTTFDEYLGAFKRSILSAVAVTDHLTIAGAKQLHEELGPVIIVGQEFRTHEGEGIGLFLTETIPPNLTFAAAAAKVRDQGGLIYVPHPGDANRRSITFADLHDLCTKGLVDIVESGNSKISDRTLISRAYEIAESHSIAVAASSDAHVPEALGSSYTTVAHLPRSGEELKELLRRGTLHYQYCDPPRAWASTVLPSHSEESHH
jgi:predicted metal-dependent phosphoesterase TrpH